MKQNKNKVWILHIHFNFAAKCTWIQFQSHGNKFYFHVCWKDSRTWCSSCIECPFISALSFVHSELLATFSRLMILLVLGSHTRALDSAFLQAYYLLLVMKKLHPFMRRLGPQNPSPGKWGSCAPWSSLHKFIPQNKLIQEKLKLGLQKM